MRTVILIFFSVLFLYIGFELCSMYYIYIRIIHFRLTIVYSVFSIYSHAI